MTGPVLLGIYFISNFYTEFLCLNLTNIKLLNLEKLIKFLWVHLSVAVVAPANIVGAQRAAGDPFLLSGVSLRFSRHKKLPRDFEGAPAYFCVFSSFEFCEFAKLMQIDT